MGTQSAEVDYDIINILMSDAQVDVTTFRELLAFVDDVPLSCSVDLNYEGRVVQLNGHISFLDGSIVLTFLTESEVLNYEVTSRTSGAMIASGAPLFY
jgi:hypothetical protein